MKSVRLFDLISFAGAPWQITAQTGNLLTLTHLDDGHTRQVTVTELLAAEDYIPDTPDRLPDLTDTAILDTLNEETRERTLFLYNHIHELVHGIPPVPFDADQNYTAPEPDPRFADNVPKERRIEAMLDDFAADGYRMSRPTLYRMMANYRDHGIAGLVDQRKRRHTTFGRTDPRVVALLEEEIADQTNLSTGTRSRAIERASHKAKTNGWPVPSQATMYRVLAKLERDRSPFGQATTRRTKANRPDRAWGRRYPQRPGEIVEIDSTPLDLMVIYPDGTTGRIDVTAAIDVATRTILALIARPVATKGVDAAVLLAKAMAPLPMQPGWIESLSYSRSILPDGMLPDDEASRAQAAARPIIVPESITMDRGKTFMSNTFLAACDRLQINLVTAAPRTPTDKPHIESFFRGLRTRFVQYLDGYTGPNVVQRGQDPSEQAVYTMSEVQDLMDMWVVGDYQNHVQDGLRHPAIPQRKLTPNEMYAALTSVAPQVAISFERDDYISLMPLVYRTIQPYGINFEGLQYASPELTPYRGMPSGLPAPASGKWEVRYDPHRMNAIWVRDHKKGRWIEATWIMNDQVAAPFSLDVLNAAKRRVTRVENTLPGGELAAQVRRILVDPQTTRESIAARRSSTADPSVPESPANITEASLELLTGGVPEVAGSTGPPVPEQLNAPPETADTSTEGPDQTPPENLQSKKPRKKPRRIDEHNLFD